MGRPSKDRLKALKHTKAKANEKQNKSIDHPKPKQEIPIDTVIDLSCL